MRQGILLLLVFGLFILCAACAKVSPPAPTYEPTSPPYPEGEELLALAESREEAEEIAALYGIDLVSFSHGVATFHTEEDPSAVVARGIQESWPLIEVNYTVTAADGVSDSTEDLQAETTS